MTNADLKKKIKTLVDEKHDAKALRRIHDLLIDPALEGGAENTLRERLDRAEEDFRAGRVMDVTEARQQLKVSLEQHRAENAKRSKRA